MNRQMVFAGLLFVVAVPLQAVLWGTGTVLSMRNNVPFMEKSDASFSFYVSNPVSTSMTVNGTKILFEEHFQEGTTSMLRVRAGDGEPCSISPVGDTSGLERKQLIKVDDRLAFLVACMYVTELKYVEPKDEGTD